MNLFRKPFPSFFALLLSGFVLQSCVGMKSADVIAQLGKTYCNQQNRYNYTASEVPKPIHETQIDSNLLNHFSFRSINAAYAIGIADQLSAYIRIHQEFQKTKRVEERIALLELSQKINQRINTSSLEISAITSEIDCEEEQIDQVAGYLKSIEDNIESRLTVGAIVVGAAGAFTSALLMNNGNAGDYVGLISGTTEATLGLLIFMNQRKTKFYHERNALREIWLGNETSHIFPPSVWYYLNYFNPDKPDEPSLRYKIIERWLAFGQIAELKSQKRRKILDLYFGNGGIYTSSQLNNRSNMLDQVEANVSLMKQDLKGLAIEFEKIP